MKVSIVSVVRRAMECDDAVSVTVPTRAGEVTILAGHEPLIAALAPGVLVVTQTNGVVTRFALGGGLLEVNAEGLTITADMAEDGAGLDRDTILTRQKELKAALQAQRATTGTIDMQRLADMEYEILKEEAKMRVLGA